MQGMCKPFQSLQVGTNACCASATYSESHLVSDSLVPDLLGKQLCCLPRDIVLICCLRAYKNRDAKLIVAVIVNSIAFGLESQS